MSIYTKKPIEIEAYQWFSINGDHREVEPFKQEGLLDTDKCGYCQYEFSMHGWIKTLEGGHIVCPKDYIITGIKGEQYPCKPDIFVATYDKVE